MLDELLRAQIIAEIEQITHRLDKNEYPIQNRRQDAVLLRNIVRKL